MLLTRLPLILLISLLCIHSGWAQRSRLHESSAAPETTTPEVTEETTTPEVTEETTTPEEPETTTTPTPDPGETCGEPGECTGKVVGFSFDQASIEECQAYCRRFPDLEDPITYVTYSAEKSFCECFETCPDGPQVTDNCPDCISSELECKLKGCFLLGLCTVSSCKIFYKIIFDFFAILRMLSFTSTRSTPSKIAWRNVK